MAIVFPDLPDVPRKSTPREGCSRSPGTAFRVETAPQQKPIDYRSETEKVSPTGRRQYSAWYWDWTDKILFGRRIEGPRKVTIKCWAVSPQHAHQLLYKKAKDLGAALGGLHDLGVCHNTILGD